MSCCSRMGAVSYLPLCRRRRNTLGLASSHVGTFLRLWHLRVVSSAEAKILLKKLSSMLAEKWETLCSEACGCVNAHMSIAIVRTTHSASVDLVFRRARTKCATASRSGRTKQVLASSHNSAPCLGSVAGQRIGIPAASAARARTKEHDKMRTILCQARIRRLDNIPHRVASQEDDHDKSGNHPPCSVEKRLTVSQVVLGQLVTTSFLQGKVSVSTTEVSISWRNMPSGVGVTFPALTHLLF
jgi:hypothetical protein